MRRMIVLLLATAVLIAPAWAQGDRDTLSLEATLIEGASTPEHHTALARQYQERADAARAQVEEHKQMVRTYGDGRLFQQLVHADRIQQHCQELADRHEKTARLYENLALLHKQLSVPRD